MGRVGTHLVLVPECEFFGSFVWDPGGGVVGGGREGQGMDEGEGEAGMEGGKEEVYVLERAEWVSCPADGAASAAARGGGREGGREGGRAGGGGFGDAGGDTAVFGGATTTAGG